MRAWYLSHKRKIHGNAGLAWRVSVLALLALIAWGVNY